MLRLQVIVLTLLCLVSGVEAQYKVTGGSKTPLLAYDDTSNRIQVYLVYGASDIEISYTSSGTSHKWYRYKNKALEAESINSSQVGTTSSIRNVNDGYGYFVEESGQMKQYIWIIDYSQHAFDISNLQVADRGDPCNNFYLTGEAVNTSALTYQTPVGNLTNINRTFYVSYTTMEWSEENQRFTTKEVSKEVSGNPFNTSFEAPLCDTYIRLSGDSFARHFGIEKAAQIDDFTAVALEVHADTTIVSLTDAANMTSNSEGLSAPATILFKAYANEPVAALYIWTIYRGNGESEESTMIMRYTGEEVEYTFIESGDYYATLEVTDRSTKCTDVSHSFSFSVSDFFIDIPNAFSPGTTPGINDEFRVIYKSIYNFKGWIFNRWGVEMFHWTDPSIGWDGKKGGKYVSPGVYFYVIEFKGSDGKSHKRSGHINILRPKNENNTTYD